MRWCDAGRTWLPGMVVITLRAPWRSLVHAWLRWYPGTDALDRRRDLDQLPQHQSHGLLHQVPAVRGAKRLQQLRHGRLGQAHRCALLRMRAWRYLSRLSPVAPFTEDTAAPSPQHTTPSATATSGRERSSPRRQWAARSIGSSLLGALVVYLPSTIARHQRRAPPATPLPQSSESSGTHAQRRPNPFASAEIGRCREAARVRPRHGTVRP